MEGERKAEGKGEGGWGCEGRNVGKERGGGKERKEEMEGVRG